MSAPTAGLKNALPVVELNNIDSDNANIGDNADFRAALKAHHKQDLSTAEVYYRRIEKTHPESNLVKYVLAHLLYDRRENLDESLILLRAITAREPGNASFGLLRGKVCSEIGRWDEAIDSFRRVIEETPRLPDSYWYVTRPMIAAGRARELVDILDSAHRRFPEIEVGRHSGFVTAQRDAIDNGTPSILLITMPKSGSIYTATRLSEELGAPLCRISLDLVPKDHVVPSRAASFANGGAICQEHLDASDENLDAMVKAGIRRIQVHVRDPRQATLSWVHHVETMVGEESYLRDLLSPKLPAGYNELSFTEKIDWHLDNHLPALVE